MPRSLGAALAAVLVLLVAAAPASAATPQLQRVGTPLKATATFKGTKPKAAPARAARAVRTLKARAAAAGTRIRVRPGPTFAGYVPMSSIGIGPQAFGDDELKNFPVPAYRYDGQISTSIGVSTNGYVVVGGADSAKDASLTPKLPSTGRPNGVLAPFWTDLQDDSTADASRGIWVATVANTSAPPCVRSLFIVVEWRLYEYGTTTERRAQAWIQADDPECPTDPVPAQATYLTYDLTTLAAAPTRDWAIGAEDAAGIRGQGLTAFPADHLVVETVANNDAPVAVADSYTVTEDAPRTVASPGLLANDTDTEGSPLSMAITSGPQNGSLVWSPDGAFTYTPDPGFVGADSFTYRVSDGERQSNVATVALDVRPRPNAAPVAVADAYTTNEGAPLNVAAPGVVGNDSDADGDPLTTTRLDDVDHGTLTLNADGSFDYVPDAGYSGPDAFTYRLGDGRTSSAAATVTIDVVARPNAAPATTGEAYATPFGTTLAVGAPGLLANDRDADGDPLAVAAVDAPAHGTLVMRPDGSFAYAPDAGYSGPDRFAYKVTDGRVDSPWTVVTVDVQAPPAPPGTSTSAASLAAASGSVLGPDLTAPIVSAFKLPKTARLATLVRGIQTQFRCDEACSITVRMSVRKRGAKLPTTVLQTAASTRTSGLQTLRMRLKRSRMRRLASRDVRVAVTAIDASGNRSTLVRTLRLR
jgi:hypothetical protein